MLGPFPRRQDMTILLAGVETRPDCVIAVRY